MARGWDSKAIEDQQAAAAEERSKPSNPPLSAEARERQAQLDALRLCRTRLIRDLETASNRRYHEMLEQALAHIEGEIAKSRSIDQ